MMTSKPLTRGRRRSSTTTSGRNVRYIVIAELSVTGLSDDVDLRMPGENGVERHAREEVVLDEKNADLFHIPIHRMT